MASVIPENIGNYCHITMYAMVKSIDSSLAAVDRNRAENMKRELNRVTFENLGLSGCGAQSHFRKQRNKRFLLRNMELKD